MELVKDGDHDNRNASNSTRSPQKVCRKATNKVGKPGCDKEGDLEEEKNSLGSHTRSHRLRAHDSSSEVETHCHAHKYCLCRLLYTAEMGPWSVQCDYSQSCLSLGPVFCLNVANAIRGRLLCRVLLGELSNFKERVRFTITIAVDSVQCLYAYYNLGTAEPLPCIRLVDSCSMS